MTCKSCANEVDAGANFCPFCGARLKTDAARPPASSLPASPPSTPRDQSSPATSVAETLLVPARCSVSKKPFLIRFERDGKSNWLARTATPLSEQRLRNPALQGSEINGQIRIADDYPGCPHCGAQSLLLDKSCGGKVACRSDAAQTATCPWCGTSGPVAKGKIGSLRGSADR